jgi:hypothetical protein
MRYRLRTLLIVLALGPPITAWLAWPVVDRLLNPGSKLQFIPGPVQPGDMDEMIGVPIIDANLQ